MDETPVVYREDEKPKRKKRILLRIVIWLVIIAAIIFLTLFLAARIGEFDSIMDMLNWIKEQIKY